MGNPTQSSVHVNKVLTNFSLKYTQDDENYVASKVFPDIPVKSRSDRYVVFDKGAWFRSDAKKRGVGQRAVTTGYDVDTTPSYYCDVWSLGHPIDDQLRSEDDGFLELDKAGTELLTSASLLREELQFKAKFFTTSLWSGADDYTPGTLWSAAGSTPIENIELKIDAIRVKIGRKPNTFVISANVWSILKHHSELLARIAVTNLRVATPQLLAQVLEIDKVLIAGAVQNTAAEGATPVMVDVFTDDCLLVYAAPKPSKITPSGGYTFRWTGYTGATKKGGRILKMRLDPEHTDLIEIESAYDQVLTGGDCGCFFDAVIA